jgi:uncharacterized protein (DUF433 family)
MSSIMLVKMKHGGIANTHKSQDGGMIMIERITANPHILGGKPIIRGTRISVEFILDLLASDVPDEEILEDYPHLTKEDIQACLRTKKDWTMKDFLPILV